MKASVLTNYGSPDFFEFRDVAKPTPKDNEVLIKVYASSINSWDWEILIGKPFVNRLMVGLRKPTRIKILGCDISGRIETVGKNVKNFKVGDEVFADLSNSGWGGFAEYVCAPANKNLLALKPTTMTFEQAAVVPQAAVLALQGLRKGQIDQARTVMINGASGGVGSFAVPMAKSYGAEVTGVCPTNKMDFVRSLGADYVIDFTQQDFTRNGQQYDLILDVQGHHSIVDYRRALSTNGCYIMVGGSTKLVNQLLFLWPWLSLFSHKKMHLLMHKPDANDLNVMKTFFEAGSVSPVIDKCYPLSKLAEAMRYYGEGHVKGKIAITIVEET